MKITEKILAIPDRSSRGLRVLSKCQTLFPIARVLLVNDQQTLLEEMEQILVTAGCEVRSTCRQSDATSMAKSFFLEAKLYGYSPKDFNPQFVMLGLTVPVALGHELWASDRAISKLILWGKVQNAEDLEKRREYYDFELIPTPIGPEKLHVDLTSWIAEAWTDNGYRLNGTKHQVEALECHEEALRLDPLCINGWSNKGLCMQSMSSFSDALQSFDKAIEVDASRWRLWLDKGIILNQMGRYEDAIRCFDTALKLSSDIISVWKERGIALDRLGRYEEAIASYDEVFKIDYPGWTEYGRASAYADALSLKGVALSHANRLRDAIDCYDRAISMDPKEFLPYYNKGIALGKMGRTDEAIIWYEKALKIAPWYSESWNNKGDCHRALGQTQEAITCFEKALACDDPEILAWYNMGQALEDLGQIQDALAAYEKYLSDAIPGVRLETEERARARLRNLKSRIGEQS
jgi:tetratricopeptide (TPR) repeat protein